MKMWNLPSILLIAFLTALVSPVWSTTGADLVTLDAAPGTAVDAGVDLVTLDTAPGTAVDAGVDLVDWQGPDGKPVPVLYMALNSGHLAGVHGDSQPSGGTAGSSPENATRPYTGANIEKLKR